MDMSETLVWAQAANSKLKRDSAEALEQVQCAQVNLENLARYLPAAEISPLYKIVQMQLAHAETLLLGER